jgi:hypothetical protein
MHFSSPRLHPLFSNPTSMVPAFVEDEAEGARKATWEMMKNRGLVASRKKEVRNPRLHARSKFKKVRHGTWTGMPRQLKFSTASHPEYHFFKAPPFIRHVPAESLLKHSICLLPRLRKSARAGRARRSRRCPSTRARPPVSSEPWLGVSRSTCSLSCKPGNTLSSRQKFSWPSNVSAPLVDSIIDLNDVHLSCGHLLTNISTSESVQQILYCCSAWHMHGHRITSFACFRVTGSG